MILQVAAIVSVTALGYLRWSCDRAGAVRDAKWIVSLWYLTTPRLKPRWIMKVWFSNFCAWVLIYQSRQRHTRGMANLEAEIQKGQKELQHGLYRNKFDHNVQFSPMKPVIFPCRTSHVRLFPKKHSFSYSYLLVGIPVGWRGYVSTILSADLKTLPWSGRLPRNGWFNVDSANHLARGEHMHGLQGKLEDYLESQNERIEDYPYAYLVTAPLFLGYSFNPVSFWYLYDQKKTLRAMILEVNNTFDERRMYFLKNDDPEALLPDERGPSDGVSSTKIADTESSSQDTTEPTKFSAAWSKDFHVSPFNSRKGAYSLSATDPFTTHLIDGNPKASCGQVNNTITLSSSKNHPKLIARVFSTADSIDPYALSESQIARFVLSWWWVGFVTFPRIVREAAKLFFRRKLHVWFRPEVLKDSLGRSETGDERAIAVVFTKYLQACVKHSKSSIPFQFMSGISTMPPSETFLPDAASSDLSSQPQPLVLKILTPLFYAQLARHTSIHDSLRSSLTRMDSQASTFYTSNPESLLELFDPISLPSAPEDLNTASTSQRCRWLLLAKLRHGSFSQLDLFIQERDAYQDSACQAYRKAVIKILLSDRLAFGMPAIIDAVLSLLRVWLCWICTKSIDALIGLNDRFYGATPLGVIGVFLSCVGLHLWAFVGSLV